MGLPMYNFKGDLMNLVLQPHGSWLCGQACVAMIAGITLGQSISVFGKRSGTSTKEVISALKKLGIKCGDKLISAKSNERPSVCMCVLHFKNAKSTHWTIWNKKYFMDPAIGYVENYSDGIWATSYLPIYIDE